MTGSTGSKVGAIVFERLICMCNGLGTISFPGYPKMIIFRGTEGKPGGEKYETYSKKVTSD